LRGKNVNADMTGMLAGLLTTAAFVPQAWRIWKTRSTHDLSLLMYAVFTAGVALWLAYGFMTGALPVILTNAVTLLLAGVILVMKLRFG
jgi:MtN3 and saliva related transmembrane protein